MSTLLSFVMGASFASFIYLVVERRLRNESIVVPRSHCENCQTSLAWFDLIPIISYLTLRGRCRYCKIKIDCGSFWLEILLGFLLTLWPFSLQDMLAWLFILSLVYLSLFDAKCKHIPLDGLGLLFLAASLQCHHQPIQLIIAAILYLGCLAINRHQTHLGNGDLDVLFIIWLMTSVQFVLWLALIACLLALLYLICFPCKAHAQIAFVPFIAISYVLIAKGYILLPSLLTLNHHLWFFC